MLTSRTLFTWKQKAELWERWKNGQSVLAISRGVCPLSNILIPPFRSMTKELWAPMI